MNELFSFTATPANEIPAIVYLVLISISNIIVVGAILAGAAAAVVHIT